MFDLGLIKIRGRFKILEFRDENEENGENGIHGKDNAKVEWRDEELM